MNGLRMKKKESDTNLRIPNISPNNHIPPKQLSYTPQITEKEEQTLKKTYDLKMHSLIRNSQCN